MILLQTFKRFLVPSISFQQNAERCYCSLFETRQWKQLSDTESFDGIIPLKKLEISYTFSSGPGGQNVNKSCTKVELRFRVDECDWIAPVIRDRFFDTHKHRISKDGYFIIRSERTRSQSLNLADCMDKLRSSIRECRNYVAAEEAEKPTEEDLEFLRKKQEAVAKRRVQAKRYSSELKKMKRIDSF